MSLESYLNTTGDVLEFIPKLRALGVMQWSGGGVSFALGPLPTAGGDQPQPKAPPVDAVTLSLGLRGTKPEEAPKEVK